MSCHDVRHMHPRHSHDISSEDPSWHDTARHDTTRPVMTRHDTTWHDTTRHDPSRTRYHVSFVYHFTTTRHQVFGFTVNRRTETLTFWWNFRAKSTKRLYPILVRRILKDVVVKQSGIGIGSWLYQTWKDAAGTHVGKPQNWSISLALWIVTFGGGHNLVRHVSFRARSTAAKRQNPERLQALHGGHVLSLGDPQNAGLMMMRFVVVKSCGIGFNKIFRAERESN